MSCEHQSYRTIKQDMRLEDFWRDYANPLFRRALGYADGRKDIAEELVSVSIVKIISYMRRAERPIEDLPGLAFATLRNVAYDRWRKKRRDTQGLSNMAQNIDEEKPAPTLADDIIISQQYFNQIENHLQDQPQDTRDLFHKRFILELPYSKISKQLNISEALARKRVQTLRKKLRIHVAAENNGLALTEMSLRRPNSKSSNLSTRIKS